MKILGIETSCDETAFSLIQISQDKTSYKILGNALHSQIETHKQFGGVFPVMAKREHIKNIIPLFHAVLKNANVANSETSEISAEQKTELQNIFKNETDLCNDFINFIQTIKKPEIDLLSVTSGPGLEPALWVGINFARALSYIWQIPLLPINHMEGHIVSVIKENQNINEISFPSIALLISGGHTELILANGWGEYKILGQTRDDAVGEAYDKVARLMNLSYPGGPKLSALAQKARAENVTSNIKLPRPMLHSADYDFSFAGLKTAVLYSIKNQLQKPNMQETFALSEIEMQGLAREFEDAVVQVLFHKTEKAVREFHAKNLIIGGGVIANSTIREKFQELQNENINVLIPEMNATTDNALMIAIAGFLKAKKVRAEICPDIIADGNLSL